MGQDLRVRQYSQTQVQTADRGKLLLMVYDLAISSLQDARRAMTEQDFDLRGQRLDKGLRAIGELRKSLDMERGREISQSLDQLYDFMMRRITEANMNNDPEHLDVVIRILEDLRETWAQVIARHEGSLDVKHDRSSGMMA